jgi:hypothetical protein
MPRTAPAYTGTYTWVLISYRWIDANGQTGSTPVITTPARATVANVEGMADAIADMSNANLYDIVYEGHTGVTPEPTDATEAPRESVKDVIVLSQRDNTTRQTQGIEVPAPLDALFVDGTNQPDVDDPAFVALLLASSLLLPPTFDAVSIRFSEHKGYNKSVKL